MMQIDIEEKRRAEAQRYTRRNILRSEFMYGRGFQSPGGYEAVASFCRRLDLRPGMRVLEVGSGIGGSALYLARHHGVQVLGLDVSHAMVEISNERRVEEGVEGVRFARGDIRTAALEETSFDVVWTRDCVLYLAEKDAVWQNVARCLKPGGQLFITDFARGAGELTPPFRAYLDACDYHLQTLDPRALEEALREEQGNVARASARLGLSRSRVRRYIERQGIDLHALRTTAAPGS